MPQFCDLIPVFQLILNSWLDLIVCSANMFLINSLAVIKHIAGYYHKVLFDSISNLIWYSVYTFFSLISLIFIFWTKKLVSLFVSFNVIQYWVHIYVKRINKSLNNCLTNDSLCVTIDYNLGNYLLHNFLVQFVSNEWNDFL